MPLYKNLSQNNVPIELVFCGNKKPDFELPSNFKFIYSEVKPAQCFYIAFISTVGKYVLNISDDLKFSPHALDKMLHIIKTSNRKTIVSPTYYRRRKPILFRFDGKLIPVCSLISRKLWNRLGGPDRRFQSSFWDHDMALRLYAIGGTVKVCKEARVQVLRARKASRKKITDKKTILKLWWEDFGDQKILTKKRKLSFLPLKLTNDILTKNQN